MTTTVTFILGLVSAFLFTCQAVAQPDVPAGARAAALGNASVTLPDVWAVQNNVAGIAGFDNVELGAYVENRFGVRAFTTVAFTAVYPTRKYGNYGLSISRFGDELFNQQHLGFGIAHKLGQFSLGAKLDVWQIAVKGGGSRQALAFSVGGQAEVTPGLYFGAHAYNLNQAKLAAFEDERLPTIMKAGLSYRPYHKLLLAVETEKNIDYEATLKAGMEYQIIKDKFTLRSGFQTLTNTLTFGAGFRARQLFIDYAYGNTTFLGSSHHLSINYQFEAATEN